MSASNGVIPNEENSNFFTKIQTPFPVPVDGSIDTSQFLDASRGILALIDQFGKVFMPVWYDMNGNVEKINDMFIKDQAKYKTLNVMVLCEKAEGAICVSDALLWLRRGLHFFMRLFELILEDNEKESRSKELAGLMRIAYVETLRPYHGWMTQQMFRLLSRMSPTRSQLEAVLSLDQSIREDIIYRDMASFTKGLRTNIACLIDFYQEHELDSTAIV